MTLRDFISRNKDEIDSYVRKAIKREHYRMNYEERRGWVLNDESLYLWARREGVRI